jgi:hypothetical protein
MHMKSWMNIGLSGECGWPSTRTEVTFGNTPFVLLPRTVETAASIHAEVMSADHETTLTDINRFLSVVSWAYKEPLQNEYGWSGNPQPTAVPNINLAWSINNFFLTKWAPLQDARQRLALALYREALTLNSVPYSFLGFFKIINVLHKNGPQQIAWIKETLPKLNEPARQRIDALSKTTEDVAKYLYESGRCAVAHAFSDPLIDPDDISHLHRLSADIEVVRALAEHLIEHELHVPAYP